MCCHTGFSCRAFGSRCVINRAACAINNIAVAQLDRISQGSIPAGRLGDFSRACTHKTRDVRFWKRVVLAKADVRCSARNFAFDPNRSNAEKFGSGRMGSLTLH